MDSGKDDIFQKSLAKIKITLKGFYEKNIKKSFDNFKKCDYKSKFRLDKIKFYKYKRLKMVTALLFLSITLLNVGSLGSVFKAKSITQVTIYAAEPDAKKIYYIDADEGIKENELKSIVENKISETEGKKVETEYEIEVINDAVAPTEEILTMEELTNDIAENIDYKVKVSAVYVNGEEIGYMSDRDEINALLDEILDEYRANNSNATEVYFLEKIKIEDKFVTKDEINTEEEIRNKLSSPKIEEKVHTVTYGDSLWQIAVDNDISMENIVKLNEGITEDSILSLDQEIKLGIEVPFLSIVTVETVKYEDIISRQVKEVPNDDEYVTYKNIITEGSDGAKTVEAIIKKVNGNEVNREIKSETVITEPVEQVVEVGTMKELPKKSVGSFKMPTKGILTDTFGTRGGAHKGIDIASSSGTPIYASDGGVVTRADWFSGFGYIVIVDHENGYETYYAHNSALKVSAGQRVAQGELVSLMGTTGNSTGNHLHFEVRKNGTPINPFSVLK